MLAPLGSIDARALPVDGDATLAAPPPSTSSGVEGSPGVAYSRHFLAAALPFLAPMKPLLSFRLVLPLVLGMMGALAIAVYAELGNRRLEAANRQMAVTLDMQSTLNEAMAFVVDAETGQRGFLLTGKEEYLAPYQAALPQIDTAIAKLRELQVSNGTPEQRAGVGRFTNLVGRKLGEIEASLELYRKDGAEAAQALFNTGLGKRTMDEIRASVEGISALNRKQQVDATRQWASDIAFTRVGMQVMTAFTIALLLIVWYLARRDVEQREALRHSVEADRKRLETMVEERTGELSELSNHLQVVREDEKSRLARDIHDELGGILVSAKMDVAWVGKRLEQRDPEAAAKLERALQALDDGVQIKRRIIEELRPTLLDNLGLAAALDWQVHEICDRAGLACTVETPADDSSIEQSVAIALYRIVQEALTNIVKYARARNVNVDVGITSDTITLLIEDDGIGIPDAAQKNRLSHGIAGMRQRVRALQGEFSIAKRAEGGTIIEVNIPRGQPPAVEEEPAAPNP